MTDSEDMASSRPLPDTRNATRRYWESAAEGALFVTTCRKCARPFWYPRPRCPFCGSSDIAWIRMSGKGSVHTYTVVRQSSDPYFRTKLPYVVAMVDLDDGPRVMTNIVECDVECVAVGMRVSVVFETASAQIGIPLFVPDRSVPDRTIK